MKIIFKFTRLLIIKPKKSHIILSILHIIKKALIFQLLKIQFKIQNLNPITKSIYTIQYFSILKRAGGSILVLFILFTACSPRITNPNPFTGHTGKKVELTTKQQEEKENLIIQAKKEGSFSDLESARKNYLKVLKIDPSCDVCYFEMAMLYYRAGYLINAINLSRTAYNIDTTNIWYKKQLANFSMIGGNYPEAEKLYSSLLSEDISSPDLYYSLASVYENMRKYDNALALYDSAQFRFGFNTEVAARKQEIYVILGKSDEGIAEAQKLIDYDPEDPRFYTLLGDGYAQTMNDSMAVKSYNSALAIDSSFPPAVLGKAEIARKAGNFKEYFRNLELYCESDKIDDRNKIEYLSLVLTLPSFSEYFKSDIDNLFTILNKKHPKSNEVKYLYASFLMQTAQSDSAISLLKNLIKTDSTNYNPWNQILSMEYSLMSWNELKTDAGKAISIFPDRPYFYMYRGVAYWQLNELNNAATDFEYALKASNKDIAFTTQIYAFLGDLYHQMGKEKKSFKCYEEVLKIDTLNATVLNNYAYFLALKNKNMNRAYSMSKKAIELEPSNHSFLDTFGWILYLQGKLTEARAIFRQAIASGGKESAVVLDHYANVLYALGEHDTASIYWNQALEKADVENSNEIKQKLLKINKK